MHRTADQDRRTFLPQLTTITLLAILATPAAMAQEMRRGWLSLGVGSYSAENVLFPSSVDPWLVKAAGGLRIDRRWAVELGASHSEHDTYSSDLEVDNLELSARFSLSDGDRWDLFLLAGPGWSELDRSFGLILLTPNGFPLHVEGDGLTAHLGVGFELDLGERWFFRPEVRQRWWIDGDGHTPDFDAEWSLGAGLRF